ncbi:hypothetical protein FJZ36_12715 [Candidatus Poribacteria bacterium]|nr:hypothetical protein [Candidatus Poribacteria bacterium]
MLRRQPCDKAWRFCGTLALALQCASWASSVQAHEAGTTSDTEAESADVWLAVVGVFTESPTSLIDGAGHAHQAVTTAVPQAQAFYDQGLAWMHSYFWLEAARSFRQALVLDPQIALAEAHLGLAYAELDLMGKADGHFGVARGLAPSASERERLNVEAILTRWEAMGAEGDERDRLHEDYITSLDDLLAKYPDDAEVWVARGVAQEGSPTSRGQLGSIESVPYYETALRYDPDHVGARHYLVHAWENLQHYGRAASEAAAYASNASAAPHAQHMYGHVLPRVGRWDEAIAQFERADTLARSYVAREGIPARIEWHQLHNLYLLGLAYARVGRMADSERTLREAFETRGVHTGSELEAHPAYIELLIHLGRYDDARRSARVFASRSGPIAAAIGAIYEAESYALENRLDEARSAADRARTATESADDPDATSLMGELDAMLALAATDPMARYAGALSLQRVAETVGAQTGFDGWGSGFLRLSRLAQVASATENASLAQELTDRLKLRGDEAPPRTR